MVDKDQSLESTDDRWFAYKQDCQDNGIEPKTFGEWMRAGQPLPIREED